MALMKGQADRYERKIEVCNGHTVFGGQDRFQSSTDIIFDLNVHVATAMDEYNNYAVGNLPVPPDGWIRKNLPGTPVEEWE